jgi:hypothetical protein
LSSGALHAARDAAHRARLGRTKKKALQLGAGVRVDFAVQANFFKGRCGPFHFNSPIGPIGP